MFCEIGSGEIKTFFFVHRTHKWKDGQADKYVRTCVTL